MRSSEVQPSAGGGGGSPERSNERAEQLARRLDGPMSLLGILFLLVVLGENMATDSTVQAAFAIAGWVLWALFVAEFALRWWVADDRMRFFKRNWWQLILLAMPFLRFVRLLAPLRYLRTGRVLSSAVRGSRSAARLLSGRLAWLAAITVVIILATAQALYLLDAYATLTAALHGVALAAISGEPLGIDHPAAQVSEIALAAYSVIVFATLAASLGAYFLEKPERQDAAASSD